MRLRLPYACQPGCALCTGALVLDAQTLSGAELPARLEHAQQTNQRRVYVQGTNLASSPHLSAIVRSAKLRGLQVALVDDDPGLDLPARARSLQQMGIAQVYISLRGAAAESPEAASRSPDWRKQAVAVLLELSRSGGVPVGVHLPLSQRSTRELPAVLRFLARLSLRELLISEVLGESATCNHLDPAAVLPALERVWLATNAQGVRVRFIGFERTRYVDVPLGEPAPACDSALLDSIRHRIGLVLPHAGIRALGEADHPSSVTQLVKSAEELRNLGLELAARRSPFVDLPACLGGTQVDRPPADPHTTFVKSDACPTCPFDERCPGASTQLDAFPSSPLRSALRPLPTWYSSQPPPRVLILSSVGGDGLFYISTLPALADALQRRGVPVEIVSPWLSRWTPGVLPALDHGHDPANWMGTGAVAAWLETHDLRGFDLVIASDFPTARVALATRSLDATARLVVLDFHMLETMHLAVEAWLPPGGRAAEGGWWPSEQLILESGFPAHVQLYLNYGVPLAHIAWRPFPLCPGHFPPGPDVHACNAIFSGGEHLRDLQTLREATERLAPSVHVVDLYAFGERFEENAHLCHQGSVSVQAFYAALAHSRFVVLPLQDDTNCAAGVTVLAMALMAGRPLVATGTAAIRDYVQHGAEALLVPPGDPQALADAITRLDTDAALLSTLADGARRAGQRLSTDQWAEEIVSGAATIPLRTPLGWRNW